jgi:hypothetical protein
VSRRVVLAHSAAGAFAVVLCVFAAGAVAIGLLLALGADRVAAAQPGTSPAAMYVIGALFALVGLRGLWWAIRSLSAVAAIRVEDDGSWTLLSRFGRTLGRVGATQACRLALAGFRVYLVAGAVARRQEVVRGTLTVVADGRRYRLAESGPVSYDGALAALGYQVAAPRPGQTVEC